MKVMNRNKQKLSYMLYIKGDALKDEYGNETGEFDISYGDPVEIKASVSPAFGNSQQELFGTLEGYDKVVITDDMACPINENTVLFLDKEPEFADGQPIYDYVVKRVAKSLNFIAYAVRKVVIS